jgi:RNA polymerase sigma-70 factor (ECF subfamily)
VSRFVRAYESHDLPGLVSLLTDDVFMSMPPMPLEYVGTAAVSEFMALLMAPGREYRLVSTRANYQPAFDAYVQRPDRTWRASGLFVTTIASDRISSMTRFESDVFPSFGLPDVLPGTALR